MRLQLGKVDGDDLVVLGTFVGAEAEVRVFPSAGTGEILQSLNVLDGLRAASGPEVSG